MHSPGNPDGHLQVEPRTVLQLREYQATRRLPNYNAALMDLLERATADVVSVPVRRPYKRNPKVLCHHKRCDHKLEGFCTPACSLPGRRKAP